MHALFPLIKLHISPKPIYRPSIEASYRRDSMTRVAKQSSKWSKPIEPRIASYSSDQKIREKILWLLPPENSPWESVTVISSPLLQIISPLGIYTTKRGEKEFLYTIVYPGTKLYNLALEATELCIKFPSDPLPFYLAVLGEDIQLLSSKAIRTPCIDYSGSRIEALVARREQVDNYIQLYLHPVYLEVDYQRPFTRLYGCSIEFLVAYSRIKYWLSKTTLEMDRIENLFNQLKASLLCLKRLERRQHRKIYHYVNVIIRRVTNLVYSTGYTNSQLVDILTEEPSPVS